MIVGVCFPTPGKEAQPLPDASKLRELKDRTRATHLRMNFHHDRPDVLETVQHVRDNGFDVLPILDFDYDRPDVDTYARFCARVAPLFLAVEMGNEPYMLHRMDARKYAHVASAGAKGVTSTSSAQIYVACEATKPIVKPIDYWRQVERYLDPAMWDVAAIHPYRNPLTPSHAPMGSRKAELWHHQKQMPYGKGVAITEVGWDIRDGVTPELQAQYTYEELCVWEGLGVDAVYVYAHTEPPPPTDRAFGIFDHEWRARPVADAIGKFQQERGH